MDIKKLDNIKTPEDWLNEALNPTEKEAGMSKRNSIKKVWTIVAAIILFILCTTSVTMAATKSNIFQSFLEKMFGKDNVKEVELTQPTEKIKADINAGTDGMVPLKENTMVVGENESFISEYHFAGDIEKIDQVYTVVSDGLKKMKPINFEAEFDGKSFSFQYVTSGDEIYAFNCSEETWVLSSYCKGNVIYGLRKESEKKAYLLEINLKNKKVRKISDNNMLCNFVISQLETKILCNHRGDGYWSVFNTATHSEKKISTKLVNGYARTNEIEFLDEDHILTYGETIYKDNTEISYTYLINLQTMKIEQKYPEIGLVNLKWTYKYNAKKNILEFYEIAGQNSITIKDVKTSGHVIAVKGNYVLFGSMEKQNKPFYLINLSERTWKKIQIPKNLIDDMEIHFVRSQKKLLITNNISAYLVDISEL